MSDVQTPNNDTPETPSTPTAPEPKKGGGLRLAILLIVLLAALGGLLYDYQIARPAVDKARAELDKMLDGTTKDPDKDGTFSPEEVHQLLGRDPNVVEAIDGGRKEYYFWMSGLPFRKYKIVISYWGTKSPLLNSYALNAELRKDQLPPKSNIEVPELTEEQKKNFKPVWPTGGGMGDSNPDAGSAKKAAASGKHSKESGTKEAKAPPSKEKKEKPAADTKPTSKTTETPKKPATASTNVKPTTKPTADKPAEKANAKATKKETKTETPKPPKKDSVKTKEPPKTPSDKGSTAPKKDATKTDAAKKNS